MPLTKQFLSSGLRPLRHRSKNISHSRHFHIAHGRDPTTTPIDCQQRRHSRSTWLDILISILNTNSHGLPRPSISRVGKGPSNILSGHHFIASSHWVTDSVDLLFAPTPGTQHFRHYCPLDLPSSNYRRPDTAIFSQPPPTEHPAKPPLTFSRCASVNHALFGSYSFAPTIKTRPQVL